MPESGSHGVSERVALASPRRTYEKLAVGGTIP